MIYKVTVRNVYKYVLKPLYDTYIRKLKRHLIIENQVFAYVERGKYLTYRERERERERGGGGGTSRERDIY